MKKFSLNAVAAAALGFAATGAFAVVDIDLTTQVPVVFAKEIIATTGAPVTLTNAGNALDLQTDLGYSFSDNEIRYVRVELTNGVWVSATATAGAGTIGAVNGIGTSVIYFSITAPVGGLVGTTNLDINGNRSITSTASNMTVSYSMYDQPSQAQAGGTTGRIVNKADKQYVNFAYSQRVVATADSAVANVEVTPAFTTFLNSPANTANSTTLMRMASLDFKLAATVPLKANGTAMTLADLNATGTTGTKLVVSGDFTAAANSDGTYTGAALNRVYMAVASSCAAVASAASALTASSATFNVGATATTANPNLCFAPRDAGVSTSTNPIPAATYTAALNAVSATPTTYAVETPLSSGTVSTITRNGTELQAPLVQVPSGYITRFILTNTGSVDATYTGTVTAGPGSVIGSNGTLTGTIPAGGQAIIEGTAMPQWTSGPARGFARFTVARPSNQIQGVYQITNAATGSVSNTVMVRPGTN